MLNPSLRTSLRSEPALESLRVQIERIEGQSRHVKSVLPFGVTDIHSRHPGGGLALGTLHENAGWGQRALDGAAASLFAAGVAVQTKGKVLWVIASMMAVRAGSNVRATSFTSSPSASRTFQPISPASAAAMRHFRFHGATGRVRADRDPIRGSRRRRASRTRDIYIPDLHIDTIK